MKPDSTDGEVLGVKLGLGAWLGESLGDSLGVSVGEFDGKSEGTGDGKSDMLLVDLPMKQSSDRNCQMDFHLGRTLDR